ncbi:hypothetical protein H9Q09_00820 [Aurantimonas sp. DM33-3]|uniref:hypothetical protein n=1 Tax=Aurantimonas sp. DM33-3 TaxID=2766955 RepID=UPI001651F9D6|nr:hypothetical protein [Aurantimonas sp. DM33-3]MBC6714726.1 hypothetical protein [Aurantimonas sp. DM33-3]
MAEQQKSTSLTVRLSTEARARLDAASQVGPYAISLTSVIERGIELAARELEEMAMTAKEGGKP